MTNSFCDVKISMMFTPDQRLMLFLRENDSTLGHLIYQKQVHTEEKNKSAQLLQAMFNKRHLNAKDKVSNDGSYELEMGVDHNYTTEHIYAIEKTQLHFEYNFYNKDSYHDWKLFSSLDAFKIGIMWFKLPELDVPVSTDIANTSALSGCDAGTS